MAPSRFFALTSSLMMLLTRLSSINAQDATYFSHAGAPGTEHFREEDDPNFYQSNSQMPILPIIHGFTGTHGVYLIMGQLTEKK